MRTEAFTVALAALVLASCSTPPVEMPVTQQQQSFSDFDKTQQKSAPGAVEGITGERIAKARSEPQNWLTYYGAYDAQRYSPLDQINAGNVARLKPAWIF
jgi:glucose dehydrogenase